MSRATQSAIRPKGLTCRIVVCLLLLIGNDTGYAQVDEPISKDNLVKSLQYHRVSAAEYVQLIRRHGVNFRLTTADEQQIRVAGSYLGKQGLDDLLSAARDNYKLTILVARFQTLNGQNYAVNETMLDRLRVATKNYSDTRIVQLNEIITAEQGDDFARAKGRAYNAEFVIWGWLSTSRSTVLINVHFVIVQSWQPRQFLQEQETLKAPLAELDVFNLQSQISSEMAYLTLLAAGLSRFQVSDFNGAIERFTRALGLPNAPEQFIDPTKIYRYRGDAYLKLRNYDLAIADYNSALKLKEDSATYIDRGIAYVLKVNYDLAISDFGRAIELEPIDPVARIDRGVAYYLKEDYGRAVADLDGAIKLKSDDADAYYDRGLMYDAKGDYDLAIADYSKALKLNPLYVKAYHARGDLYYGKKHYDLAIADYNKVIELKPRPDPYFPNWNPDVYYDRGLAHYRSLLYDRAIADFETAIKLKPDSADAFYYRGNAYYGKGNYDQAFLDFDKVIALKPDYVGAYIGRGLVYAHVGKYDLAIADYDSAIKLKPDDSNAYVNRGLVYDKKSNYDLAIADYYTAIKLKPDDAEAYLNRGAAYASKGNHDLAIADFDTVIKLHPGDADAYYNRGMIYAQKGITGRAIADLYEALRLSKDTEVRKDIIKQLRLLGVKL